MVKQIFSQGINSFFFQDTLKLVLKRKYSFYRPSCIKLLLEVVYSFWPIIFTVVFPHCFEVVNPFIIPTEYI